MARRVLLSRDMNGYKVGEKEFAVFSEARRHAQETGQEVHCDGRRVWSPPPLVSSARRRAYEGRLNAYKADRAMREKK